jgi:hypothetical protein
MSLLITSPQRVVPFAKNDTNAAFRILPLNTPTPFYNSPPIESAVTFLIGTGVAAAGSYIEFFGVRLYANTFSDSYNFLYDPISVGATYIGIIDALNANFITAGKFDWAISGNNVTFTWNVVGDYSAFKYKGFDKVSIISQTKGSYFILKDGYQIIWEGHYIDNVTGDDLLLTKVHKTGPIFKQSRILETPILLNRYVSDILKTDTSDDIFFGNTVRFEKGAWAEVYLKASETELINGLVVAKEPNLSTSIFYINARLKNSDLDLSEYYGTPPPLIKFLNQRKYKTVCRDEYFNLYLIENMINGDYAGTIRVKGVTKSGMTFENITKNIPFDDKQYMLIIPAGVPQSNTLFANIPIDAKMYSIEVGAIGLGGFEPYSEKLTICVDDCDCEKEELYFVSEKGAYDTIRFKEIDERSINVSQVDYRFVEHFRNSGINLDRKLKSNVRQTNTIAQDKITLVYESLPRDSYNLDFIRQFLESEYRFIRRQYDGVNHAVSFILESSETVIYKRGEEIDLIIRGYVNE